MEQPKYYGYTIGTHGTGHKGIPLPNTHSLRICDRSLDAIFSIRGVKANSAQWARSMTPGIHFT